MGFESDEVVTSGGQTVQTKSHFASVSVLPGWASANFPVPKSASSAATILLGSATPPPPPLPPAAPVCSEPASTALDSRTSPMSASSSARCLTAMSQLSSQSQQPTVAPSVAPSAPTKRTGRSTDDELCYLERELATSHVRIAELERKLRDALRHGAKADPPESRGGCWRRVEASPSAKPTTAASPSLERELSDASTAATRVGFPTATPLPCVGTPTMPVAASVGFAAGASKAMSGGSVAMTGAASPPAAKSTLHRSRHSTPNLGTPTWIPKFTAFPPRLALSAGGSPVVPSAGAGRPLSPMRNSNQLASAPLTVVRSLSPLRSTREVVRSVSPLRFSREVALAPTPMPLATDPLRPSTPMRVSTEAPRPPTPMLASADTRGRTLQQQPMFTTPVAVATVSRPVSPQPPALRRGTISPRRSISPRRDEVPRAVSVILSSSSMPPACFQTVVQRGRGDARSEECARRAPSPLKASTNSGSFFSKNLPLAMPVSGGCDLRDVSPLRFFRGPTSAAMNLSASSSAPLPRGSSPMRSQIPVPSAGGSGSVGLPGAPVLPKRSQLNPQPNSFPSETQFCSYPSPANWQRKSEHFGGGGVEAVISRENSRPLSGKGVSRSNSGTFTEAARRHSASPFGVTPSVSAKACGGGSPFLVTSGDGGCGGGTAVSVARDFSPLAVRPLRRGTVLLGIPVSSTVASSTSVGDAAVAAAGTEAAMPTSSTVPCGGGSGQPKQRGSVAIAALPFAAVPNGCGTAMPGNRLSVSPCGGRTVTSHDKVVPVTPVASAVASAPAVPKAFGKASQMPWRLSLEHVRAMRQTSPAKARPGTGVQCLNEGKADVNGSPSPHPGDVTADPRVQAMQMAVSPSTMMAAGKEDADWQDFVSYWRGVGGDTLRRLGVPHKGVRNVGLV
eukprot:TRINITY_DN38350_c0_g1_i1.p1 TRINITY_DN38350_c0_g1~~TRINITY_DN38350_c0_g1_i1.p1  ORF type:complete len:904 (+),score=105.77 TRINITY_DN38350_c0_g1_i1:281-2992(+)